MESKEKIVEIKLEDIEVNPYQPRKVFSEDSILELSTSITKNGLIHPIIVRRKNEKFEIVSGERRFRACKKAGLEYITAILKDIHDRSSMEISIIENVQRENLNPIDEAVAYRRLIDEFKYTHDELSNVVCKSRSYITNFLRLLNLPNEVRELLQKNHITIGHAKLLINLENSKEIATEIVQKRLSVRETENLIKNNLKGSKTRSTKDENNDLTILERRLSEALGMKVSIVDKDNYGIIRITFKNLKEFEFILNKLT